ncbi:respiratory nitrate reductase subunit gamma [Leucothrix pacifica]|uniref:Nitrate reductase n=1 Tax=Leucothrix pacifica TaxID=1247513 RepID=A0A317C391_9GAMM|nr:respiratory nitrate reductase subunit gamma [Leucothrix pacifica]PWQ92767.1 nitrate reductase [Leucothrix pacifica]
MFLGIVYGLLFWAATLILVLGVANKLRLYWNTPAPLKIPTMPAPLTKQGVAWRMAREVFLFQSLFRADKLLWAISIVFHYSLLLIVLRHLRYFLDPVWGIIGFIQPFGLYAGFGLVLGLLGLMARRVVIDRVRYISAPSDYLMLVLLLVIGVSGLMMKFVNPTDIVMVKAFFQGLKYFSWQPLPADFTLLLHLTSVVLLMMIFPISKLLHAPGVFFSPSRNQVDNSREERHIAPWAAELDKQNVDYISELKK